MIRSFSGKLLSLGVLLGVFLSFLTPAGASVPRYDLERMRQLNPDFSTYPDSKGIVWLKRVSYRGAGDGGIERTHLWVLLGRRGLEDRWLNWDIPEPSGGRTTILEASVYAFDSGRKIADVLPAERSQGGVVMRSVGFGSLPETFVLVLCWKDSLPPGLNLEELIWTQETLPVWESIVEVSMPDGRPLFYKSLRGDAPEVNKKSGVKTYTWRTVNTDPLLPGRLLATSRNGIAFSTHRGVEAIGKLMRDRTEMLVPPAPPAALEGFNKGLEAGVKTLLSWLYGQPAAVLPEDCSRALPVEGPWTHEEKLLLAHAWLRERSVKALLHWKLAFDPDVDSPVCPELLRDPILEIPPFKGARFQEGFFCDMNDVPKLGKTSPLLMGIRISRVSEGGPITSRKIPEAKPAENRLRALFDLRLSPGGALSGIVRLQARGAWRSLLFQGGEDRAEELLFSFFRNLRGRRNVSLRDSGSETELTFDLGEISGIVGTQGKNMLVILPAFVPELLRSLVDGPVPLELRFPFLLEQRVVLSLPPGIEKIMLPGDTERGSKNVLYSDAYKASKLKKVTAEARLQVSAVRLAEDDVSSLKTAVDFWRSFAARPLPFQMRGGK